MKETSIMVEVHCTRPPWSIQNTKSKLGTRYRLYLDNDLIVERSWIWDNETFLLENIWISTEYGVEKNLKLEPVLYAPGQAEFKLKNISIPNKFCAIEIKEDTVISFKTYKYKIKERSDETPRIYQRTLRPQRIPR